MQIEFFKYEGTGNDFIIADNRSNNISFTKEQVSHLCHRRFGIGADGLILLNKHEGFDFAMQYYNADGGESTMCGNGGRCIVKFANSLGIQQHMYHFLACDGGHHATIDEKGWVNLKMKDVHEIQNINGGQVLDTGSPHYVKLVEGIQSIDVFKEGRHIRNSERFAKHGINVNFVQPIDGGIYVRTYERGVEDETYSCGTGVTASALVFAHNDNGFNRIQVKTPGGTLAVEFDKKNETSFENIWLCGPAAFVFKAVADIK